MKRDPILKQRSLSHDISILERYWLLLFLIVLPLTATPSNIHSNYLGDSIQSQIPLLPADNHILIMGKLNGKKAYFLLDTGASYTVLHSKLAKHYGYQIFQLPTRKRTSAGVNSSATSQRNSALDISLEIGQPLMTQSYFTQNLTPVVNHVYRIANIRIAGIIGTDLLKRYGCSLDLGNKVLKFN